ncbi:MAG: leucine-rich repeat domain-containing protein [Oligoflexales bacterium]
MKAFFIWIALFSLYTKSHASSFLNSCYKESNAEVRHTILELKKTVFTTNCQEAWTRLQKKTEIHLQNKGIVSLAPLKEFKNLRTLDVWGNNIRSLEGIEHLENLTQLWIGDNKVVSLAPLQGLKELKIFMAWDNNIQDLTPLQDLPLLELEVGKNPIRICPRKSFSKILSLTCQKNKKSA